MAAKLIQLIHFIPTNPIPEWSENGFDEMNAELTAMKQTANSN